MLRVFLFLLSFITPFSLFAGGTRETPPEPVSQPSSVKEADQKEALSSEYPQSVIDSAGKTIFLTKPVSRIVSLGPNITETVFALGKGDLLVGRTDWCDYPSQVAGLASVGSLQEPSIEAILDLDPDLVLASTHAPMETLARLDQAGLNTAIFFGPETFAGIYEVITGTAALTGAREEGDAMVRDIRERSFGVEARVKAMESHPRVYFVVGFGEGGDWTAGSDTFIHQMITMAGGDNIAGNITGWSYSLEKLVEEDPEIILLNIGLKDLFAAAPVYSQLRAVKEDRVYEIDENLIVRQGPRLIQGLELMQSIFSGTGNSGS